MLCALTSTLRCRAPGGHLGPEAAPPTWGLQAGRSRYEFWWVQAALSALAVLVSLGGSWGGCHWAEGDRVQHAWCCCQAGTHGLCSHYVQADGS